MVDARGCKPVKADVHPSRLLSLVGRVREGLPPYMVRYVEMDDRLAGLRDANSVCGHELPPAFKRFNVSAQVVDRSPSTMPLLCPCWKVPNWGVLEEVLRVDTDDEVEALAAWERAERWVRTGDLREGNTSEPSVLHPREKSSEE